MKLHFAGKLRDRITRARRLGILTLALVAGLISPVAGPAQPALAVTPPPAPSDVFAFATDPTNILVTWTDQAGGTAQYEVNNGETSQITGTGASHFDWGGLNPGKYMCFKVRSFNANGTSAWIPDTSPFYVCATTPSATAVPPAAAWNVQAFPTNSSTIRVTWADVAAGTARYEVNNGETSRLTATGATSFDWGGLSAGKYMCFKVRSFNDSGASKWMPEWSPYYVCATTPSATALPPAAPTNLQATTPSSHRTHLTWTDQAGGTARYEINNGETSQTTAVGATSFDWDGQPPGKYNCLQIRAFNGNGASTWVPTTSPYYVCTTTPARTCAATANAADASGYIDFYHATGLAYAQDIRDHGIDLAKGSPHTDFGRGFYVTTRLSQAQQWARKNFKDKTPSIVHYRVPASALSPGSLCGAVFSTTAPSQDYYSLVKWMLTNQPPLGGAGYDFVEGPLMLNSRGYEAGDPPLIGGQQDSFHSAAGAAILNNSFVEILAVPVAEYPLVLRSVANVNYVSTELGYTGGDYAMLRARAPTQGSWESWTLVTLSTGNVALRSNANNLYVSAELGYTGGNYAMLRARAASVGAWETFQIVWSPDGTFALKSLANNLYVSVELGYTGGSYAMLRARSSAIGSWETATDNASSNLCGTCP